MAKKDPKKPTHGWPKYWCPKNGCGKSVLGGRICGQYVYSCFRCGAKFKRKDLEKMYNRQVL